MAKVQPRLCCMGVDIPLDEHTEHRIMELQSMADTPPPKVRETADKSQEVERWTSMTNLAS